MTIAELNTGAVITARSIREYNSNKTKNKS